MRLAVFSDMHGNYTAFDAALADFEAQGGADHIWFLGDYAAMGPRPAECIARVKAMIDAVKDDEQKKGTIRAIYGNTDRYLTRYARHNQKPAEDAEGYAKLIDSVQAMDGALLWTMKHIDFELYDFLAKLPGECDLTVKAYGGVIGYHAVPGDDEAYLLPETSDEEAADFMLDREGRLGIGGHIHEQMDRALSIGGWRVINVGSVGLSFGNPGYAQYGIFTFEDGDVQVDLRNVPYDRDSVIAEIEASDFPAKERVIKLLREGRQS